MRLIDADALMTNLRRQPMFEKADFDKRMLYVEKSIIDSMPTIDAVPVVRCKDCKHWVKKDFQAGNDPEHLEYGGMCPNARFARYESDFCSYGERKDGEG